jgi:hypothetical protein
MRYPVRKYARVKRERGGVETGVSLRLFLNWHCVCGLGVLPTFIPALAPAR